MKASIIIPAYNNSQDLEKCLNSIKLSDEKSVEIIVVDDGSKDNAKEVAKKFKVKYFYQNNKGPASARNFGAKKSNSEILIFIDADCKLQKNTINEIIKSFQDKTVFGVQGIYKTKQKSIVAKFVQKEIEDRYELMQKFESIDFIGSYCCAYRKKTFFEFSGFDETYKKASGEDSDLAYKISSSGKKLVLNSNAIVFHKHPESITEYFKKKFQHAFWRVKLYREHKEKVIKDTYTPQILKIQIGLFYLGSISLFLSGIYFNALIVSIFFFGIMLGSFLPFSLQVLQIDILTGLISPLMLFTRTTAFALGLIYGIIKGARQ